MATPKKKRDGDPVGVIGGCEIPAHLLRDLPENGSIQDPLDKQILRLINLHPHLSLKFRGAKLSDMDPPTKKLLLEDIQEALAIKPFRKSKI